MGQFGIDNNFSVFVLGDIYQQNSDIEGRIAVGGNAFLYNVSIGSKLYPSSKRADLIVGNEMNVINGINFSGNSVLNPGGKLINYSMKNKISLAPQPLIEEVLDFDLSGSYLKRLSAYFGNLNTNGNVTLENDKLLLDGKNNNLNIFLINGSNINGSDEPLENIKTLDIKVPENSTILINVSGNNIGFESIKIFHNGVSTNSNISSYILWNFPEATELFTNNSSLKGFILAPYANWNNNAFNKIDGSIMTNSIFSKNSSIIVKNRKFEGKLPNMDDINIDIIKSPSVTESEVDEMLEDYIDSKLEEAGNRPLFDVEENDKELSEVKLTDNEEKCTLCEYLNTEAEPNNDPDVFDELSTDIYDDNEVVEQDINDVSRPLGNIEIEPSPIIEETEEEDNSEDIEEEIVDNSNSSTDVDYNSIILSSPINPYRELAEIKLQSKVKQDSIIEEETKEYQNDRVTLKEVNSIINLLGKKDSDLTSLESIDAFGDTLKIELLKKKGLNKKAVKKLIKLNQDIMKLLDVVYSNQQSIEKKLEQVSSTINEMFETEINK